MKLHMKLMVLVALLQCLGGCVVIKVSQSDLSKSGETYETKRVYQAEVVGVEPILTWTRNHVSIGMKLQGSFDIETTTVDVGGQGRDEFLAAGAFPGVMSCKGEYRDSVKNAAGAFFYNLIFAGLPTVYGLLVEPCIPHYPEQTDSIVGETAFVKSALIGFSRYSKPVCNDKRSVANAKHSEMILDNASIAAPDLGIRSEYGHDLEVPIANLPKDGEIKVELSLPVGHPLKVAMAGLEGVGISVLCNKNTKEN